jgi:DNA-directed RNA polymerase II subunit RPB1
MVNKDITMELIYHKINLYYLNSDEVNCIYTDDNANKLIFRLRLKIQKKSDANKMNDINYLKNIIKTLQDKIIIKGVNNISSVSMFKSKRTEEVNKSYERKEEWVLDTKGINMIEIMQNKNVDKTRTISNDIYEVYKFLGIEAARNVLLFEIREVISSAGSYVNYRHLSLLADIMTNKGSLMSIDRFGINRGNIGPLAKCSFEETTDQLFKASIFGELDKLNGVSANIMMGQIAPCGTGSTEIYLDESKLTELFYKPDEKIGDIETWEDQEDYCDMNIGIDYDISNLQADNNIGIPKVDVM